MSTSAEGVILAVPLIVLGGAVLVPIAACAAVAGAGVVVARETGRAVIVAGREMKALADQNLAMQRAMRAAAIKYEQDLRQADMRRTQRQISDSQEQLAEFSRMRAEQQARIDQLLQLVANPPLRAPKLTPDWDSLDSLQASVLPDGPMPAAPHHDRLSGWPGKIERTRTYATALNSTLDQFSSGALSGLFETRVLSGLARETSELLGQLSDQAPDVALGRAQPDVTSFETALADIAYLSRRLGEMRALVPRKLKERSDALSSIAQARAALDRVAQNTALGVSTGALHGETDREAPELGLVLATQIMDAALEAVELAEFAKANRAAQAVTEHLADVAAALKDQRSDNLRLFLSNLRKQVEPLLELPESHTAAADWLEQCASCEKLGELDVAAAWDQVSQPLDGLAAHAETLQREALAVLLQRSTVALIGVIEDTLQEMGYKVQTTRSEHTGHSINASDGQRHIHVSQAESGEMAVRLEGFGNASCHEVLREFLQRLQQKGVVGAWQETFTLNDAVQRLSRTLQAAGLNVKIEPSDQGVTVLATGKLNERARSSDDTRAQVDYDGRLELSEALLERYAREWQHAVRAQSPDLEAEWVHLQQEYAQQFERNLVREARA